MPSSLLRIYFDSAAHSIFVVQTDTSSTLRQINQIMSLCYPKLQHEVGADIRTDSALPEGRAAELMKDSQHVVDIAGNDEPPLSNENEGIIEYFRNCADNKKGLDIYQVCAFKDDETTLGRTLLAMFAQGLGTYYLLKSEYESKTEKFSQTIMRLCNDSSLYIHIWLPPAEGVADSLLRATLMTLVFVYSARQWFKVEGYLRKKGSGMYRINAVNLEDKPHFLSSWKIAVGRYLNIIVLFAVTFGAMFVIIGDTQAFVLKLSSYFGVLKLNKLFVRSRDYSDLKAKLDQLVGIKATKYTISKGHEFCLLVLWDIFAFPFCLSVVLLYGFVMWMLLRMIAVWMLVSVLLSKLLWTCCEKRKSSQQKIEVDSKSKDKYKHLKFGCVVSASVLCFMVALCLFVEWRQGWPILVSHKSGDHSFEDTDECEESRT